MSLRPKLIPERLTSKMEFFKVGKAGQDKAPLAIHTASLIWLTCLLISLVDVRTYTFEINLAEVQHDDGCSYFLAEPFATKFHPLTRIVGDSTNHNGSSLRILENGNEIGPPHSLHEQIRESGAGAYSYWGNTLYFSGSGCEDLRKSDNVYVAIAESTSHQFIYLFAFLPLISLLILLRENTRDKPQLTCLLKELLESSRLLNNRWMLVLALVTLAILSIAYLLSLWKSGETVSLSISGWYPVSDSNFYWKCANSLLETGTFGNLSEWCERRSIYQNLLAGLNWLGQRNIFGTLIMQCCVLCAASVLVMRQLSSHSGLCGILFGFSLIFIYAANNAIPLTLTANAGLIFGGAGVALLIGGGDRANLSAMLIGLALVSIALNARAGAFFILPALILWFFLHAPRFRRSRLLVFALAVIAASTGFLLQWLLVSAIGGDASRSHGNFSYTLYGLASGGLGWSHIYTSHPELFITYTQDAARSKVIYELAFSQLKQNPLLLLEGFKKNLILFWNIGTYGYQYLDQFADLAKTMWWLAWIPIAKNYRSSFYSMLGLMSIGIMASATWLLMDGGSRVFAATTMVDVVQMVVGFSFATRLISRWVVSASNSIATREEPATLNENTSSASYFRKEFLFASLLIAIVLIPHIVQFSSGNSPTFDSTTCAKGQLSVVTTPGKSGTTYVDILDDDAEGEYLVNSITRSNLINGTPDASWWKDDLENFKGKSFAMIQQLNPAKSDFGWTHHVYSDLYFSDYFGESIEVCVDPSAKLTIFDAAFSKVTSIRISGPLN